MAPSSIDAVNTLSRFLAFETEVHSATDVRRYLDSLDDARSGDETTTIEPTDVIVLCGSAILSLGDDVFAAVSGVDTTGKVCARITRPQRRLVVVICGGIGHSTPFMYEAVAKHAKYSVLHSEIQGLPESRVFQKIAERWFGLSIEAPPTAHSPPADQLLSIIVEDQSTNCGANAIEAKKILDVYGIRSPRSVIVVQDATMSRRTVASFEKAYEQTTTHRPEIMAWPTFVPEVQLKPGIHVSETGQPSETIEFSHDGPTGARRDGLWDLARFVDLLVGEIPRLRDDENGYGPKGKGFIPHVDIPQDVEEAWAVVSRLAGATDRPRHGS